MDKQKNGRMENPCSWYIQLIKNKHMAYKNQFIININNLRNCC